MGLSIDGVLAKDKLAQSTYKQSPTRTARYLVKIFSARSTVVLQLPCCPGKQGNSQKNVHKNLNPSSGSSINTNSVSLCIPGDGDEVADDAEGADEEEGEGGRAGYGLLGHHL